MKLEWIGHACFRLTAENGTVIVTDPYDDSVGIRVPKLTADLVTVSHEHHDHNNLDIVEGRPKVAREARAAQVGGVTTQAVTSYHDDRGGALRGRNSIRIFYIDALKVVHMGDQIFIDAFGLKAKLSGDLKVTQDARRGLGLNGQVNVDDGRFHAYGQDLIVRTGHVIFAGPPSRPQLNIEAIRNPEAIEDDVTAGIRVTGNAMRPKVTVFSEPALSQQQTLSYLLRGQGLDTSSDDNSMITSALVGLGVSQTGRIIGEIGDAVGIKDLGVDTAGVGESSQVVVSGYILPGLQLKYGVGIFDSLATITLRYRLMPRLYLEAASGVNQAFDVLYSFEY